MGFNVNGTRLLLRAHRQGVDFSRCLTLGRQGLYMRPDALERNLKKYGFENVDLKYIWNRESGFAEPFLEVLGAQKVDSIDASNYEKASVIHDMNQEVPSHLKERYTTVIDGGSLEHIFNFPRAIKNCMEMIELGGYFIGISPTNNYCGHGFFQFSPELFYRIFSKENGFTVQEILFFNDTKNNYDQAPSKIYRLKDPALVKRRIELSNAFPSYLFIVAKRISIQPVFQTYPQQSDYEQLSWKKDRKQKAKKKKSSIVKIVRKVFPSFLLKWRRNVRLLNYPFGNGKKEFFEYIDV